MIRRFTGSECMWIRLVTLACCFALTTVAVGADRVAWTSSRIVGSPDPPKPFSVQRVYPKLSFDQPVELMALGDTGKMMLLEVDGKLYTFDDDQASSRADLAIDLKPRIDNFRRAFGFGVHPNFDENRSIFVAYAGGPVARADGTRLSRFRVSDEEPLTVDPESEQILLTWPSGGHNGCAIRFDSKGLLYFSLGDGARPFPPDEYDVSQDLTDLRATICRIDVDRPDGERPYSIPPDNPFVDLQLRQGGTARPEIWAYGFRNPWRFTVVPETDQVLCGDVGWELWELVHDVRSGGNYGWSITEGPQPIRSDIEVGPTPISAPLVAYPHAVGQSVTGGIVYRGTTHEDLRGVYLYGDYVTGLLWGLRQDANGVSWNPVLAETGLAIITFAESRQHEALIVDFAGGIYQLVENPSATRPSDFPRQLSETGLFASTPARKPAPGVIPYDVVARSWENGAATEFLLAIPGTASIRINQRQRSWRYPKGTVFAKTLLRHSQPEETQILHFNGIDWQPYSYLWNDDHTDADLVGPEGLAASEVGDHSAGKRSSPPRSIQNRAQCRACHSRQNGGAVGFTLENLDRDGQLERFVDWGVLDRRAPKGWNIASMVDPGDESADLQQRARSYLAANCGHCHQRGGGGTVPMELSYSVALSETNAVNVAPTQGNFGLVDAKVIRPGDPYHSILYYRMATRGMGHMPKLRPGDNDTAGLQLVHDWIESMSDVAPASIPPTDPPSAADDTASALRLFTRLLSVPDQSEQRKIASEVATSANVVTSALFERFLPESQRRRRLGLNIDAPAILAMEGNAARGRSWLLSGQNSQCVNCHRLQGSGRSVGPDLDGIAAKRTKEQLLESILNPSKLVDPGFVSYAVLTDDGNIVTGLRISENENQIILRSADGKDHAIARDSIESIKTQTESLMPTGLAAEMTANELADLLEFLSSLR